MHTSINLKFQGNRSYKTVKRKILEEYSYICNWNCVENITTLP